ncbi:MAG: hypothetical protein DI551_09730 [Micavibrio aeruginosavorus]|uniref:VCBS repeat-containing protein n=1 Tax=Micavibrio aeruginosavorus TaxID=349221 RepID=A0A2W5MTL9_9BACT|nr:MAG: hypothetical protein DI551_09730 [Micavibrio aeruginosavorus]
MRTADTLPRMLFARLTLFAFLTILSSVAYATEPLFFHSGPKNFRETEVLDYLERLGRQTPALPASIAAIDLNGDGVEEWIIFQEPTPSCKANANCPYIVAGLSDGLPMLLGEFTARKIGISDEKQYGVRKLLVYNEKNNDFTYQTYVWTPADLRFRPE